jgi:hypothetical protein
MYAFAQRPDTVVYDEPLYAHYLSKTNAKNYHPGADEIMASMENDGEKVVKMMLGSHSRPIVFFKNMTHHLVELDWSFLHQMTNVLLTRHPKEMLLSFIHQIETPTMQDVGYAKQIELLHYLQDNNLKFIVLENKYLLLHPKKVLQTLCEQIEIPFTEKMLSWEKGARSEDGIWAKYWYQNVHQSNGFGQYTPKIEELPKQLLPLFEQCLPFYEQLKALAISV